MSAHVLLNLSNALGKSDEMRGLPSILSLFRNEFKKYNNTGARMLDSIYHKTQNYFEIAFLREMIRCCHITPIGTYNYIKSCVARY